MTAGVSHLIRPGRCLAKDMFETAFDRHQMRPTVVHSDGRPSKNRPRVSNDNPYSEAWFKTVQYAAAYPVIFHSLAEAKSWTTVFID